MNKGISIIICTYNGSDKLFNPLHAIINQRTSIAWELLLIDNASTDATVQFCREILEQSTISWRIVSETNPGLNHARLRGLKEAQYEFVLFCDDDNSLNENYIETGYQIFQSNPKVGVVGGFGIPTFKGEKPDWFDQYSHSFAVGPQASFDGVLSDFPAELYGAGCFFRKAPLLNLFAKGFTTIMTDRMGKTLVSGGDVEWCYLIQLLGYKLYYDHRLIFYHEMPASRMNWDYYLRLKAGIASGTGKFVPYHLLFKNKKATSFQYAWEWIKKTILATLRYFKYRMVTFFKSNSLDDKEKLACIILQSKMQSFYKSPLQVYRHFQQLKKVI